MNDNGLIMLFRSPHIHCAPPLIATEEDIKFGFKVIREGLVYIEKWTDQD